MDNQKGEKMKPVKSIVLILICCLSIIFLSESAAGQNKLISDGELIVERYLLTFKVDDECVPGETLLLYPVQGKAVFAVSA